MIRLMLRKEYVSLTVQLIGSFIGLLLCVVWFVRLARAPRPRARFCPHYSLDTIDADMLFCAACGMGGCQTCLEAVWSDISVDPVFACSDSNKDCWAKVNAKHDLSRL